MTHMPAGAPDSRPTAVEREGVAGAVERERVAGAVEREGIAGAVEREGVAGAAKRSPWVVGIIIGFVVMLVMNAVFITIAVKGADTVVPSYQTADR